ncbi:MAG: hypothetical protein JNM56_32445 [Planctomycetia bacterium]|nr:hypothetical protein [Planctomycetia bacterium]
MTLRSADARGVRPLSLCRCARLLFLGLAAAVLAGSALAQQADGKLGAIDLMTTKGCEEVKGEWRYAEVMVGVGPKNNDIEPKAHGAFDDSKWEVLKPETLKDARGPGKFSWCWYRIKVKVPEKVGDKAFTGGPVWFQTTVDDYGEIWVNGKIDTGKGRGAVAGFNTRNRVRLQVPDAETKKNRDPKPGDEIQIAVLGINSPLGNPPGNKIFLRAPTNLEFFTPDAKNGGADTPAVVEPPAGKEVAKIDLLKADGVGLIKGVWRRHPITLHAGEKKNEIEPKAHGAFKDDDWEKVEDPALLTKAWGPGKLSMGWYRLKVTIPEKVGDVNVAGTSVWFRTTVDDYAEVWVNGKIDLSFGKGGRGAISGFNQPNEVLLTDNAKPGEEIQLAVLAINSPFGNPPGNQIFFRPTVLRFLEKK